MTNIIIIIILLKDSRTFITENLVSLPLSKVIYEKTNYLVISGRILGREGDKGSLSLR